MLKKMFFPCTLVAMVAMGVALQAPPPAHGFANSAPSFQCMSCHPGPMQPEMVKLRNLPENYRPGQTYTFTLELDSALESLGEQQGGFAIQASAGELVAKDQAHTQLIDGILTHTLEGSHRRSWSFSWQAPGEATAWWQFWQRPEPGPDVSITVMAVAANGDYSAIGDEIGAAGFTLRSNR
ncbi:conserved hypothetical protein [Desulfurivibrio alkaliphilus AHT 2]|uniref:Reelin domain-containing protein n=2 Tax=Desulfurivibrio alkaliphilus TaxID=427923 RepID=D6Z4W1_DESAT|nr:conserved hypothetical protein [Desulfurivibrio alkaliphilus AHT 2]